MTVSFKNFISYMHAKKVEIKIVKEGELEKKFLNAITMNMPASTFTFTSISNITSLSSLYLNIPQLHYCNAPIYTFFANTKKKLNKIIVACLLPLHFVLLAS